MPSHQGPSLARKIQQIIDVAPKDLWPMLEEVRVALEQDPLANDAPGYATCQICGSGNPLLIPVLGPGVVCANSSFHPVLTPPLVLVPAALAEQVERERDELLRELLEKTYPSLEETVRRRDALENLAHCQDLRALGQDLRALGVAPSELNAVGIKP